jgi:hypothetical protein
MHEMKNNVKSTTEAQQIDNRRVALEFFEKQD